MAEKRKGIRSETGYVTEHCLKHANITYYRYALSAKSIEMEEYWYQSVFHGGSLSKEPSPNCEYRKKSYADLIVSDIFEKRIYVNDNIDELSMKEDHPDNSNEDYLVAERLNNPSLIPNVSIEKTVGFINALIEISDHLVPDEMKVLAYFLRKTQQYGKLLGYDYPIINYLIDLIKQQENSSPFPKEGLIAQFSSRHAAEVAINRFISKMSKYRHFFEGHK
jgi:hypothetical protein